MRPLQDIDRQTFRFFDGIVVFWVVLWLLIGGWTAYYVWQLSELGTTVAESGQAIDDAGTALEDLGNVPVIGQRTAEFGVRLQTTAVDIIDRGGETRRNLRVLSVLLGVAIAGVPTTPVVALYAPLRVSRRRDERAARRFVATHAEDPAFDDILAHRAAAMLSYTRLLEVSAGGLVGNDEADGARRLADAELSRMGIARPQPTARS